MPTKRQMRAQAQKLEWAAASARNAGYNGCFDGNQAQVFFDAADQMEEAARLLAREAE